jgi:hypothetical protein
MMLRHPPHSLVSQTIGHRVKCLGLANVSSRDFCSGIRQRVFPAGIDVPIPRGNRIPTLPSPVDVRVFSKDTFELGRGEFKVGEGFAVGLYSPERSLVDMIRLRHREGSDIAWEALRGWLGRKGAKPAALIEMAKALHGAERAVRNAPEIVL